VLLTLPTTQPLLLLRRRHRLLLFRRHRLLLLQWSVEIWRNIGIVVGAVTGVTVLWIMGFHACRKRLDVESIEKVLLYMYTYHTEIGLF